MLPVDRISSASALLWSRSRCGPSAMPEVTVIIPAHNCGRTIDAALESVFAQTFKDLEVVVVDDNSTDDTASRIGSFGPRVICCRETGGGIVRALNAGLLRGTGAIVAVLE